MTETPKPLGPTRTLFPVTDGTLPLSGRPNPDIKRHGDFGLEYRAFVLSLISPPEMKDLKTINQMHMVWGLCGESLEFLLAIKVVQNCDMSTKEGNIAALLKEAGDIFFYLAGTSHYLEIAVNISTNPAFDWEDEHTEDILAQVEQFMDLCKKRFFFNDKSSELDYRIAVAFRRLSLRLTEMVNCFFDYTEVLDANYAKLQARYPKGSFDGEHAKQRLDEAAENRNTSNS